MRRGIGKYLVSAVLAVNCSGTMAASDQPSVVVTVIDGRTSPNDGLFTIAISRDSSLVAAGTDSGRIVLIEAKTGKKLAEWAEKGTISGMEFFPDGKHLVIGQGNSISVIDTESTGKRTATGFSGEPKAFRFSPDGKHLAFISDTQLMRFCVLDAMPVKMRWCVGQRFSPGPESRFDGIQWMPDNSTIVLSNDRGIRAHSVAKPDILWEITGSMHYPLAPFAISPDGAELVAIDRGTSSLSRWATKTGVILSGAGKDGRRGAMRSGKVLRWISGTRIVMLSSLEQSQTPRVEIFTADDGIESSKFELKIQKGDGDWLTRVVLSESLDIYVLAIRKVVGRENGREISDYVLQIHPLRR